MDNRRDLTAVFWDTQGKIKYDIEENFFNYETSMSINWSNKLARKVLINLLQLFGKPNILILDTNGLAIWDKKVLKDNCFYDTNLLFYEIAIRDRYVINDKNDFNYNYPFLECYYNIKLTDKYIKLLSKFHNYIHYDSNLNHICIKSLTLEENLIILDLFLQNKIKNQNELINTKKKVTNKLDKLDNESFKHNLNLLIKNINTFKTNNNLHTVNNSKFDE